MIPVHNHSMYSALDGFGKPDEIADRIVSLGLPGAFLTDHGTIAGLRPFAKAMKAKDLFYGFGMEAYQTQFANRVMAPEDRKKRDQAHLILLAKSPEGFKNLMRLSDEANRTGYYYVPRVDWELLAKYKEGIICTSACMGGLVARGIRESDLQALHKYREIFRDDFYLELHTYNTKEQEEINESLVQLAMDFSVPVVVANDAHYLTKDQHLIHELMISMQYKQTFDSDKLMHPPSLYIMSEQEVQEALSYLPEGMVSEAIKNTDKLMDLCEVDLPEIRMHLPKFKTDNKTPEQLLRDLLIEGLREKYEELTDEVIDRAEYEYKALAEAGLADYFLIVRDFINWSKRRGILVGPGRGSVGGSILAYALGITDIDPLKYGLYFERFWNPGRAKGLPDIDVDFQDDRRDEVPDYLAATYGSGRVVRIGNHTAFQPLSATIDAARSFGVPYGEVERIRKILKSTIDAGQQPDWDVIEEKVGTQLAPWRKKYPHVFDMAELLHGRIEKYGIHASAYVVSDTDLIDDLPVMTRTDEAMKRAKVLATQFEMRMVEELGYPKFDLLALRNLTTLALTLVLAGKDENPNDFFWGFDPDTIPEGAGFWEQIDKGHTLGLFQIEEGGSARRIAKDVKPRSVLDLSAVVALNRPGPLRPAKGKKKSASEIYIQYRKSGEEPEFPHEDLRIALGETMGQFIFQEQVITLARLIGYDPGEADNIRKILGKKLRKDMEAEKPKFIEAGAKKFGKKLAESLWNDIESFSGYGFNKSHSVGYGMLMAWTMLAKWLWPAEFVMASIMTAKDLKRIGAWVSEGRKIGVEVLPPDINISDMSIIQKGDKIYYGLQDVKGVGLPASRWIIQNRPFASREKLEELLQVHQEVWEDEWQGIKGKRPISPNMTLKKNQIQALWDAGAFDSLEEREISKLDKAEQEEFLLGVALTDVTDVIVEKNKREIDKLSPISELDSGTLNDIICVPGVIKNIKMTKTKATARKFPNADMAFVKIEWEGEDAEFTIFPEAWAKYKYMMQKNNVGRFDLKVDSQSLVFEKGKRFV